MKNTVKKVLSVLLCAALLFGAVPLEGFVGLHWPQLKLPKLSSLFAVEAQAASGTCGTNLTWEYDEGTATLTISGTGEMNGYSYSYINETYVTTAPWQLYYNTIQTVVIEPGVTSIGDEAFEGCTGLTSVTIPDSVTCIGKEAFCGCTGLISVTIPDSVTSIGKGAFVHCISVTSVYISNLAAWCRISFSDDNSNPLYCAHNLYLNNEPVTELVIPDSVTSIGNSAFGHCTCLTSVTIPDSVTSIGELAFYSCKGLTSVTIGNSVTSIGEGAFAGCAGLTSVTIPDSVTWISQYAFYGCTGLTNVTIPDSVTSIGEGAFAGCAGLTSVTIPDSVTSIGEGAFYECTDLTSVTIPDSVTSIGSSAFAECTGLTSMTIPDSVTSIGEFAFYDCIGLTGVTIGNSVKQIGDMAFASTPLTSIFIPNSVQSIGYAAFACGVEAETGFVSTLQTIEVEEQNAFFTSVDGVLYNKSVTELLQFSCGCTRTSFVIPGSVTSIGAYAFCGSTGLTSVTIPGSVTSIGEYAFYECTGLTSVTIPDSVTSIEEGAFEGCTNLTDVYYSGTQEQWNSITINDDNDNLCNAAVHYSWADLDSGTCGNDLTWIYNPNTFTLTIRGTGAMSGYSFSSSITTAPWKAYYNAIQTVVIESGVTSIGNYAFYGCKGLTSVTIGNSVTSIGNSAFYGCKGLTGVYITDSAAWCSISFSGENSNPLRYVQNLYLNDELVTDLVIPDSVTSIGNYAFYCYAGLTSVTIPDSVTSIGDRAFYDCTGLTSVTIPDSVTSIGSSAFYNCTGLTSVTIGNSVTSLGESAFERCTGLTSVTIPGSVTSIGNYAFRDCTRLTSVTIPDSVTSIGDSAFSNCTGLTSVTIPDNVTSIGKDAFKNTAYYNNGNNWENKVLYIGKHLLNAKTDFSGSYVIKPNTKGISGSAFYGCKGLTSVTIPNSITSIGNSAFYGCTGLTEINYNAVDLSSSSNVFYNTGTAGTGITVTFGSSVARIPANLFSGSSNLKTVTIGNNVTSIGSYAFSGCTGLTSVTIPSSVTSIGNYAFYNCTGLTSATIPDSVISIGNDAFCNCTRLTSVTIGNSVTSIGEFAFYGCTGLTSVIIPDGVTSIGRFAFEACTGMTSVTIGKGVTSFGQSAFASCTGLTEINYNATNVADSSFSAFYGAGTAGNGITVTFGDSVQRIPANLFYGTSIRPNIKSVFISDSVTSIGSSAFQSCTGLTGVTIGSSVTSIGSYAFAGCSMLTEINFNAANVYDFNASSTVFYNAGKDGEGITVTFGDMVKKIPSYLFYSKYSSYQPNIKLVTISNSVTRIGNSAFSGCTGLTSVTISDSVTIIGNNAFSGCTGLTSVTIPDSVTSIGSDAFSDCKGLTEIYYNAVRVDGFQYLTDPFLNAGTAGTGINVTFGNSVKKIPARLFLVSQSDRKPNIKSVTIGNSVTSIGESAFGSCTELTSVYISDLASWSQIDFSNSSANPMTFMHNLYLKGKLVTDLVIPNGVTRIGNYAFYNCTGLTSVTIPDSVTIIGNNAFSGCTGLTSVTIGNSVTSIGSCAFYRCTGLTSVTIPDSVTSVSNSAFEDCTGLISMTLPFIGASRTATDKSSVFGYIFGSTSSTIDAVQQYYSSNHFSIDYCIPSTLRDITITDTTHLSDGAFSNCSFLTSVTIGNSVTSIGSDAFYNCTGLTSVTIPDSVTSIGIEAFYNCTGLKKVYYAGSESDRAKISIGSYNSPLTSAAWTYNWVIADPHTQPADGAYRLDFEAAGGTFSDGSGRKSFYYNVGESITGLPNASLYPTCGDLKFDGWSSKLPARMPAKDLTFSAVWKVSGKLEAYTTTTVVLLNRDPNKSYTCVSSVTIGGKTYEADTSAAISETEAEVLKDRTVDAYLKNNRVYSFELQYGSSAPYPQIDPETRFGYTSNPPSKKEQVMMSLNDFKQKIEAYYNSFGESVGGADAIDYQQLANDIKANDPNFFAFTSEPEDVKNAMYLALARFLTEVSDQNQLYLKINTNVSASQAALSLLKQITASMVQDKYEYCCGEYKVTFDVLNFSTSFSGNYTVEKYKGSDKGRNYSGLINASANRTQQAMAAYVENLGDLVEDECKYAVRSLYTEFKDVTGLAKVEDAALRQFFDGIGAKLVKYFGDLYRVFVCVKTAVKTYQSIEKAGGLFEYLAKPGNAQQLYDTLTKLDFSDKGLKKRFTKQALAAVERARKTLINDLYNYLYDVDTGDPDNKSFIQKAWDGVTWFTGNVSSLASRAWKRLGFACPVEFEVYDENGELIGYVDSSDAHDDYINYSDEICIEVIDNVKYLMYPADKKITLVLKAYDDGEMSFAVEEFNNGEPTGKTVFPAIPLTKNENYTQVFDANFDLQAIAAENSAVSQEFDAAGTYYDVNDSDAHITINCIASDGGEVLYAKECAIGSIASITALPDEGYYFVGWIREDQLISHSSSYSFVARENVTYVAMFARNGTEQSDRIGGSCSENLTWNYDKRTAALTISGTGAMENSVSIPPWYPYAVFIRSVIIEKGVTTVEAFNGCDNLSKILIESQTTELSDSALPSSTTVYCYTNSRAQQYAQANGNPVVLIDDVYTHDGALPIIEHTNLITGIRFGTADFAAEFSLTDGYSIVAPDASTRIGTGTKIRIQDADGFTIAAYEAVIFGDVDGDSWYDGTDAYFVRLIANGLISANALTEAQRMAADCNHDGVIDSADVALLEQAGLLLANVDQTLPSDELQTNSVYLEYCGLIDQSVEIIEPEQPTAADTPAEEPAQTAASVWQIILDLFKRLVNFVTMIFSIIVIPK